ncbi:major Facilitator Superfamily protein, partial [Vibrio parahaemolyticus V-223/04]
LQRGCLAKVTKRKTAAKRRRLMSSSCSAVSPLLPYFLAGLNRQLVGKT